LTVADRLRDKVAIVTGASSAGLSWGNGKATAVQLPKRHQNRRDHHGHQQNQDDYRHRCWRGR
jgi:NAD(P)-dependent dehydrogenase (short-subunit alcohol dehydrogenase family)